jgi:hypothetical protein
MSAVKRVAISDARLREAGGAKKAFRLSATAHEALLYLMRRPDAPSTETALVERLLTSASKTARSQEAALLGASDTAEREFTRPFEHLSLGRALPAQTSRWFAKPPEKIVMSWELWRTHTLIRHNRAAADGAAKIARNIAWQVLLAGGRVLVLDNSLRNEQKDNLLLSRFNERFPGLQVVKTRRDLDRLPAAFDESVPHPGGSAMLYVCGAAAHAKDEDGYNAFVHNLRTYVHRRLGPNWKDYPLPHIPYLIILKGGVADGVFRHICPARMRALGSAFIVLAENDELLAEHVSQNVTSHIMVDAVSDHAGHISYHGHISKRSGAEPHDFVIDDDQT